MTEEITVDIAITCYNTAKYIEDCLQSIVDQSYKNWRMIIVDDGSKDNSIDVIKSFIKRHKISKKCRLLAIDRNCGYGKSLKTAIESGDGDIVFIVDSDDALVSNDAISLMVNDHMNNPDVSLIYSNYYDCDVKLTGRSLVQCRNPRPGETYLGNFQGDNYMGSYLTISHLKSFKRKYYNITEGLNPDLKKAVDKDLILKLEEVGRLKYLPETLYLHRRHDKSISSGFKRLPIPEKEKIMGMKMGMYREARDRRKKKLKIFLDSNAIGHIAISRMLPLWKKMGCEVTTNPNDKADVQLSFVRIEIRTNLPKVIRVDGVYYDSTTDFRNRNTAIGDSYRTADGIIYQSNHSMKMCEKYLGKCRKDVIPTIIYNGIQKDWCGSPIKHNGINIAVANKWRRHKRLQETINIFLEFLKYEPNSMLHIFGKLHNNDEVRHPNIRYYGHVDRNRLIDIYKKTDFTIHLSKRDSCPNSVVEYIGAGIPVITTNNCGGATEMCELTEGCIIVNDDGDYNNLDPAPHYRDQWNIIPKKVKDDILEAMKTLANEKRRVELSYTLTIEHMAETYVKYLMGRVK